MFGFQMPQQMVSTGIERENTAIPPLELFVKIEELTTTPNKDTRSFKANYQLLQQFVFDDSPDLPDDFSFRNDDGQVVYLGEPRGELASNVKLHELMFLYRQEFYKHHAGDTIANNMQKVRSVLEQMRNSDSDHELHEQSKAGIASVHNTFTRMVRVCRHWTVYSFITQQMMPARFMFFDLVGLRLLLDTLLTLRKSKVFKSPIDLADVVELGSMVYSAERKIRYNSYFAYMLRCQDVGYFPPIADFVHEADNLESKPAAYRQYHLDNLDESREILSALSYVLNIPIPSQYRIGDHSELMEYRLALTYYAYSPMLKELNVQYKPKLSIV